MDKILNAFQKLEITGGGKIQNFDIFDHENIRITYLNRQGRKSIYFINKNFCLGKEGFNFLEFQIYLFRIILFPDDIEF